MIPIPALTVRTTTVAVPTQFKVKFGNHQFQFLASLKMNRSNLNSLQFAIKNYQFLKYDEENRMSDFPNISKFSKTMLNFNWFLGELIQLRI